MLTVFSRKKFSEMLKLYRHKNGLTQDQFAKKIGVSRSTIAVIETEAQSPTMEVLNGICKVINAKVEDFFIKEQADPIFLMMGKMLDEDKPIMSKVIERINIRKKYISLNKRLGD